jgi:hypothetical protein
MDSSKLEIHAEDHGFKEADFEQAKTTPNVNMSSTLERYGFRHGDGGANTAATTSLRELHKSQYDCVTGTSVPIQNASHLFFFEYA